MFKSIVSLALAGVLTVGCVGTRGAGSDPTEVILRTSVRAGIALLLKEKPEARVVVDAVIERLDEELSKDAAEPVDIRGILAALVAAASDKQEVLLALHSAVDLYEGYIASGIDQSKLRGVLDSLRTALRDATLFPVR